MCGLTGVFGVGTDARPDRVSAMAAALRHRGPDDADVWCDEAAGIGIGHTRLAIVDLSAAGHQPMRSASGRYVLAFNGEIYNHDTIRAELAGEGRAPAWRGHSDTETLLAGIEAWGIAATITKVVGMFALAVWDAREGALTIARDRLGEKPLYYGWQGSAFIFGSELKALKAHPAFAAGLDRDALTAFIRYGYIPAPMSIFAGIHKLPPATLLTVTRGGARNGEPVPYWSLLDVARQGMREPFTGSDADAQRELEATLAAAVSGQQMSDVPLGAFLSGGIDSSLIVSLMQAQSSRPIHTFTIGFDSEQYNEAVQAKAVARHLGTDHTELYVTPEEARDVIPRLPTLYDEPFADSSQIPTFLVSQLARRHVTVSLSGDAGDELFGGYNRYSWVRKVMAVPAPARRLAAVVLSALSPTQWERVAAAARPLTPAALQVRMPGHKAHKLAAVLGVRSEAELFHRLISIHPDPESIVIDGRDPVDLRAAWDRLADFASTEQRMMALDALAYLPDDILCKVDRAAMGVSLETRVPFLDHRVVALSWRLPLHMKIREGQRKWILRQILYKHVPRELIERPKMGFGVPIDAWLRGPLRDWAEDLLGETRLSQEGYLRPGPIRRLWAEHLSARRDWQYPLWNVLMFQAWRAEWA